MANKGLFASLKSLLPRADARNEEGAVAYQLPVKHALAQLAATGCFNGAFYAQADDQAPDRSDILNVGGFSDAVFRVVASFLSDDAGRFVAEVEAVEL